MYNPVEVFLLGIACGIAMVSFALLAVWLRLKDASLSAHEQSRNGDFFGKGMVWAGLVSLGCAVAALIGALASTFALPHLEWSTGVLIGAGVPLGLRRVLRRGNAGSHTTKGHREN